MKRAVVVLGVVAVLGLMVSSASAQCCTLPSASGGVYSTYAGVQAPYACPPAPYQPYYPYPYAAYRPPYVGGWYGPGVIVHPKVYVPGQPVRNLLRAFTP
jgi:hypothetical protein